MPLDERAFDDATAAEAACAAFLVERLSVALAESGDAIGFMISGGATPTRVLPSVAAAALDWSRVVAYASDERIAPSTDPASTEGMALRIFAEADRDLRYVGLNGETNPDHAVQAAMRGLAFAPWPPAVAFLGTAPDGHVASLFPGRPEIAEGGRGLALVPETPPHAVPRITHRLANLLDAKAIALVVAGAEKRAAYDAARTGAADTPLAALLQNGGDRTTVFLAP